MIYESSFKEQGEFKGMQASAMQINPLIPSIFQKIKLQTTLLQRKANPLNKENLSKFHQHGI